MLEFMVIILLLVLFWPLWLALAMAAGYVLLWGVALVSAVAVLKGYDPSGIAIMALGLSGLLLWGIHSAER